LFLKKEGYETHISRDGADGINQIDILKPDLIIEYHDAL
jgi:DNA-binding response OmpR family regulator